MSRSFTAASSQYLGGINPGFPAGDWSLSLWFYTSDVTTNRVMASYRSTTTAGNVGFQFDVNAGSARLLWGVTASYSSDAVAVSADTWTNVVGTRSGNNGLLYAAGTAGSGFTDTDRATVNSLNIGAIVNGSSTRSLYWSGLIAEVAIWDGVALTAAEVTSLAKGCSPLFVRPAALTYCWPLVGRISPEIDVVGKQDIALVNTPTAGAHPRVVYPSSPWSTLVPAAAAATTVGRIIGRVPVGAGVTGRGIVA